MKNRIDVSVIIPAYNPAETIDSLVNKILSETHVAIELIVIDDGSTDETANILRQIHDDRLILIKQANQGVYAARNTATSIGESGLFSSMLTMILPTGSLKNDGKQLPRRKPTS